MSELRPDEIIRVLNEHRVRFVLIGGLAATLYGSPHPTFDVDITPDDSPENLTRLSAALRALDARIRVEGITGGLAFDHDAKSLARMTALNLVTHAGDLDSALHPSGVENVRRMERPRHRFGRARRPGPRCGSRRDRPIEGGSRAREGAPHCRVCGHCASDCVVTTDSDS